MIGPKHVCYIPNIQEFMLAVFDGAFKDLAAMKDSNMRRCPLCFGLLRDQTHLLSHLKSGMCYKNASQPPAIILPPEGTFLNYENITLGETPQLQVIIDSEARLVPRTRQEKQRYVSDDVNDDVTIPDSLTDGEEEEEEWVDVGLGPEIPGTTPEGYYNSVFEDIEDNGNVLYKHVPQSIGLAFLDEKGNLLQYDEYIDDDIQFKFADILEEGVRKHMEDIAAKRCPWPYLTETDLISYANTHNCQRCNIPFRDYGRYVKNRHHDHYTHPKFSNNGKVEVGNYLGALCMTCNIFITSKRKRATCVFHNMSSYDMALFLEGMCHNPNTRDRIKVLPKGGYGFYNVKLGKTISFIDSYSFLPSSLAELVKLKC